MVSVRHERVVVCAATTAREMHRLRGLGLSRRATWCRTGGAVVLSVRHERLQAWYATGARDLPRRLVPEVIPPQRQGWLRPC